MQMFFFTSPSEAASAGLDALTTTERELTGRKQHEIVTGLAMERIRTEILQCSPRMDGLTW